MLQRPLRNQSPDGSGVPILGTPPVPTGFTVRAGIDTVVAWWTNPYRFYQNHARTRVYRHTADEFGNATLIGASLSVTYVDRDVMRDTTYFYWIRWESDTEVLGQPTDSFEVTTKESPSQAIDRISDEIANDPFTDLLTSPIRPIPPIDTSSLDYARELFRRTDPTTAITHIAERIGTLGTLNQYRHSWFG